MNLAVVAEEDLIVKEKSFSEIVIFWSTGWEVGEHVLTDEGMFSKFKSRLSGTAENESSLYYSLEANPIGLASRMYMTLE